MRSRLCALLCIALVSDHLVAAGPRADAARASIDRLLARYGNSTGPGCVAGVLLNHAVVFQGASGTMDGMQPLTSVTPMYLASVSKQFTATLVYMLAERGKIRLDESIRTMIPELTSGAATIRQLLNHTSGLRDYSALQEVAGGPATIDNLGVLRLLSSQRALNFEPGTDYEYSNSDYVLLSMVVERASGIPLAQYAKRELFAPLGMDRSWFQSDSASPDTPARGYAVRNGTLERAAAPLQTSGDGGMYSSVSDLLRWMQQLERPGSGASAIRQIQMRARLKSGELLRHASGLFWNRYRGRTTVSHNGAVAGFQADVVHFPKVRLSVVCLCNRGDVDAASLTRQIADVYLGTRSKPSLKTARPRPIPADLAGKWQSRQGFILSTKVEGGHLIASLAGETYVMSTGLHPALFSTESETFRLLLRRRHYDSVDLGWEGDRPNSFQRLGAAALSTTDPGAYVGRFRNDELNVTWNLVLADGSLVITTAAGWRIPLASAAQDRFEAGPWVLQFDRDTDGISGFRLHRERLWNLAFQRLTGPPPDRK